MNKPLSAVSIAIALALVACGGEEGADNDINVSESALTVTANQTGTNNGFYFQYWKDNGTVTMNLGNAGQYSVSWQSGTYDFVGGKGWTTGSARTINYNAGTWSPGSSNAYLTVYGWLQNPLIEYYIVDTWGSWRPTAGTLKGTVSCDGANYDVYQAVRTNAPSIEGTKTFNQWWSVRQSKKATGSNTSVNTSCHFNYWKTKGLTMGTYNYQMIATEVYNPASTGSSNITVW